MSDEKALQILFDTYWTSKGWRDEPQVSLDDFKYAKASGYMFEPVTLSHDKILKRLKKSFKAISIHDIANAFLASLSTRRLELRSVLGSYAIARNLPNHKFRGAEVSCDICGEYDDCSEPEDLSILNFERYKWGGVNHEQPLYIAFDLEQFSKLEKIESTKEDLIIMRGILSVIQRCEKNARPRDLEKKFAKVLKSNKDERRVLIEILSYCGILKPTDFLTYFEAFVRHEERALPPASKIDWTYPVCWWRGSDGINEEALEYYFPQLLR